MSSKSFPGFMGKATTRSGGARDLSVSPSGAVSAVLGPVDSVTDPRFRIVDVAGAVLWADDDQAHVFQETKGGKDVLVFRLASGEVNIPLTGASLYIRIGDEDTKYALLRNYSPFEIERVKSQATLELCVGPSPPNTTVVSGGGKIFVQTSPSLTWIINHNLGYRPVVSILRDGVTEVEAGVSHPTINQTRINFLIPTAGSARLV